MGLFDFITGAIESPSTFIGAAIGLGLAFAFPALLPLTALGILGTGAATGAAIGALFEFTSSLIPDITSDSSTYSSDQPVYTVEEGKVIAKPYGRCRIAGNIIRSNDPGETTLKVIIGHGQGEIDSLLSWKINDVEWDHLTDVKWWVAGYAGSVHFKNTALGTDSQNVIQVDGADLFTLDACAHRGIAHTGFKLTKNDQVAGLGSILIEGRFVLCEPIGGGAKVFSRCPAVIMWDFYRDVEDYEIADLDINAFKSLETLCDFYPTSGDGGPIRPPGPNNTTVRATSFHDSRYCPFFSFDINKPITGTHIYNSWASAEGQTTNQRLNVDLGVPVVLTKIVLVNHHSDGGQTTEGIQNFIIQGSNTASDLAHTTYADAGSGWTDVQTGLTATQYDSADPYKSYEVASPGTAYRYYSIKIANNHGGSGWLKVRDICFWGRSSRYTFDFNFDTEVNINDAKKLIWSSFNGRVIRSQGKLKPVWDWSTMADGSGGLTTKTSQYSFTMDNIVKGSFTWFPRERANKITIEYLDSSEKYKKTPVTEKDDSDIDDRGEITLDTIAYYITQGDVAARRCRRQLYRAMYADYQCKLTGFSSSQKLEVYDLVDLTHILPDWTAKKFIILDKAEDEYGRPTFLLEAYYAGVFDDLQTPIPQSYFSQLPNPSDIPSSSTNITATLVAPGSGYDYCAVKVSFTPPAEYLFYSHTEIYASRDDSAYYYIGESSGEDFVINGMGALYRPGDTCYIKLVNVNSSDIPEPMPSTYDASVVISAAIQMASFYADLYNFWGGNAAINHADTKIVMGNLDGTPKIALGVSADAITFAGTQSGFFVDGDGNLRAGGTQSLKWDPSTSRLTIGEWIISPNGIADNFTEANATILLDKTNALMRLGATSGDYITIDGANQRVRSSNYVSGVVGAGVTLEPDLLEVGNIACRGIFRTAVFQKDVVSCIGGNLAVLPADVLDTDMTAADASTLTIEGNESFAVGDFLRIKDGVDDEWFEVTNIGSAPTYTVTRDKAADYAANTNPAWKKGASVINFGQSGDGAVYMTASETNAPYLSVFTHAGSPWTALTTRVRIGNLNGFLGYASDLYGIAIGETNKYLKYDPTNGLKIKGLVEIIGDSALQNMLMNGGFEETDGTNAYYWEIGTGTTTETAGGDDSNKYLKLVRSGSNIYRFHENPDGSVKYFEVNEGEVYEFGGSVKTDGAATGGIVIRSSDKDKANFAYTIESSTNAAWTTISETYTIPAGKKFLNLYVQNIVANGWAAFDNVYLKRIDEKAWSFTHANDRTKIDGGDIYANSITLASAGSDFNLATITGDLDDIANGASYGRVALTAISGGKIVLTSAGVSGSLPTSLSDAKCTDVNADQTSVNTAADIAGQGSLATLNTVNATYIDAGSITLVKCAVETTNQMFSSAANRTNIEAWRHASDATLIDGGDIYALSVTAEKLSIVDAIHFPSDEHLAGYWAFDDGSGRYAVDGSGNGQYGDAGSALTFVGGTVGKAIVGTNNVEITPGTALQNAIKTGDFSISFWWTPKEENDFQDVISFDTEDGVNTVRFEHGNDDATKAGVYFTIWANGGSDNWYLHTSALLTYDTTYHIVCVCDRTSNDISMYIAGAKITPTTYNKTGNLGTYATVSKLTFFDGSNLDDYLDEVRIYDTVLTANEIKALSLYPAGNKGTTINGSQITTVNLSAISADLGSITAGTITMPNTGWIKGGQTDFATGTGFFLGYSGGGYKLSLGSPTVYIKWDASDLTMSDGLVQRKNFPLFVVGNLLEIFSDAVVNTNSTTPDKVKEIYIVRKGTLRIKFSIAGVAVVSHAKIYRNGGAVGTLRTGTGVGAWVEHSQDLGGWNPGDYVQIYAWDTDGNNVGVKHFRLYSNKPCVNLVIT